MVDKQLSLNDLAREAQKNPAKVNLLLQAIEPKLKKFVLFKSRSFEDGQDILQESLLSISESLLLWTGRGSFLSFAYAVTRHEISDFYIKRRWQKIILSLKSVSNLIESVKQPYMVETKIMVKQLLRLLPLRYRLVLKLKYNYGFSVKEIAKLTRTTPKAIESLLFRARKKSRLIYAKLSS